MKHALIALCLILPLSANAIDASHVKEHANEMFDKCDSNRDGRITKDEYQREKMEKFSQYDKNNDGALTKDEHQQMASDMHDKMDHHDRDHHKTM